MEDGRPRAWVLAGLASPPQEPRGARDGNCGKIDPTMRAAAAPSLCLLGPVALRSAGTAVPFRPQRPHQLLAVLALRGGEWVDRDWLAGLFWPDHELAQARRNLRKVIFKARELSAVAPLEATDGALRWGVASDVQDFRQALRERRLADAVALLGAAPLHGLHDPDDAALADWLGGERQRLVGDWQQAARERLVQLTQEAAPLDARLGLAGRLLAADPLDESAVASLIDIELARGNSATARRAYRDYAERLAGELGIEPSHALRERLRAMQPTDAAQVPAADAPPRDAAEFIGRRSELAELEALLAQPETRLLTLLGPGGAGKSRLARQSMPRCARHFGGGAVWIELQDLGDTAGVTARLAKELGVDINDTRDALGTALRALPAAGVGRTLIVLDNAEHLADLPAWIDRVLTSATQVTLLLTSRQRMPCAVECLLPLAGLASPEEDSRDLEAARAFDAVRLFEARAQRAQPGFDLATQLSAVLDIVDQVAGLPLAIELAASWMRLMPAAEIARELRQSIDVLQRDPAAHGEAARPEHRSLEATLEGSWRLLAPRERQALSAVSVFEGGFTRAAAQAVARVGLPLLASLCDRSLLRMGEEGHSGRFSMHPHAAAWARAKLADDPARLRLLQAEHLRHHAAWFETLAPLAQSAPRLLFEAMLPEQANWTAAWRHAVASAAYEPMRQMLPALLMLFQTQGRWNEGLALLESALQAPADGRAASARTRTRLMDAVAVLLYRRGDLHQADEMALAAIRLAQPLGEIEAELGSLNTLGLSLWMQGRTLEALPHLERALVLARQHAVPRALARALSTLAIAEKSLGRYELATGRQLEVLALQRSFGSASGLAAALNNVGNLYRAQGRFRQAVPYFEEGLQWCTRHRMDSSRAFQALNLGLTLFELGEPVRAEGLLQEALDQVGRGAEPQIETAALMALAQCDMAGQRLDRAAERLRLALALSEAKGFQGHVAEVIALHAELCAARGNSARALALWIFVAAQETMDESARETARRHVAAQAPNGELMAAAQAVAAQLTVQRASDWVKEG